MKISLPKEVLDSLPDPASDDGLVRVTVGIKVGSDGSANLVEVNDVPVPTTDEESEAAENSEAPEPPPAASEEDDMAGYSKTASEQLTQL